MSGNCEAVLSRVEAVSEFSCQVVPRKFKCPCLHRLQGFWTFSGLLELFWDSSSFLGLSGFL